MGDVDDIEHEDGVDDDNIENEDNIDSDDDFFGATFVVSNFSYI